MVEIHEGIIRMLLKNKILRNIIRNSPVDSGDLMHPKFGNKVSLDIKISEKNDFDSSLAKLAHHKVFFSA